MTRTKSDRLWGSLVACFSLIWAASVAISGSGTLLDSVSAGVLMGGVLYLLTRSQRSSPYSAASFIPYAWAAVALMTLFIFLRFGLSEGIPYWMSQGDAGLIFLRSQDLINDGWVSDEGLNSKGILYLYGIASVLFGAGPITPLILNFSLFALGLLALSRLFELATWRRNRYLWLAPTTFCLPYFAYLATQPGKDAPTIAVGVSATVAGVRLVQLWPSARPSWRVANVAILFTLGVLLGTIRTGSLLLVGLCLLTWMAIALSRNSSRVQLKAFVFVAASLTFALVLAETTGRLLGNSENLSSYAEMAVNGLSVERDPTSVTLSVGQPSGPLSILPAAAVRVWGYVISPWPGPTLVEEWMQSSSWQRALIGLIFIQSAILIVAIGVGLAHILFYLKRRGLSAVSIAPAVAMIVALLVTTAGVPVVHERYRGLTTIWALPTIVAAISSGLPERRLLFGLVASLAASSAAILIYYLMT